MVVIVLVIATANGNSNSINAVLKKREDMVVVRLQHGMKWKEFA